MAKMYAIKETTDDLYYQHGGKNFTLGNSPTLFSTFENVKSMLKVVVEIVNLLGGTGKFAIVELTEKVVEDDHD